MREPISSSGRSERAAFDPAPPAHFQRRRPRLLLVALPVLAIFAAFGLIVWLAYVSGAPGSAMGEPPLIKADTSPLKLSPDDQGARADADQGELQGFLRDDATSQPERLLPPPEEPKTPAGTELAEREANVPPSGSPPAPASGGAQVAAVPADAKQEMEAPPDTGGQAGAPSAPAAAGAAPEDARSRAEEAPPAGEAEPRRQAGRIAAIPVPKPSPDAVAALDSLFDEVSRANQGASAGAASSPGGAPARTADAPAQAGAPAGSGPAAEEKLAAAQQVLAEAKEQAPSTRGLRADRAGAGTAAPGSAVPEEEPRKPAPEIAAARPAGAADEARSAPGAQRQVAAVAPREASPVRETSSPAIAADGRYRIQLAAVREEADARRAWDLFQVDLGALLGEADPIIERAETANGVFYRLQIGPYAELAAAESLCERLKESNASCFVVRR